MGGWLNIWSAYETCIGYPHSNRSKLRHSVHTRRHRREKFWFGICLRAIFRIFFRLLFDNSWNCTFLPHAQRDYKFFQRKACSAALFQCKRVEFQLLRDLIYGELTKAGSAINCVATPSCKKIMKNEGSYSFSALKFWVLSRRFESLSVIIVWRFFDSFEIGDGS